jgi:molybdenum cofactor synthesis domain-containing protein
LDPVRVAILTISDGVAAGTREDRSGEALAVWTRFAEHNVVDRAALPDDGHAISSKLAVWADGGGVDLILTTGGTGFTERDTTPEATRAILEREAPGIAEAIRREGAEEHPYAALGRGVAGIRARTLIVNLPGSESGVRAAVSVLDPLIRHAVQLLRGVDTERHTPPGDS